MAGGRGFTKDYINPMGDRAHGSRKGLGLVECLRHLLAAFVTGGGGKRGGGGGRVSRVFSRTVTQLSGSEIYDRSK